MDDARQDVVSCLRRKRYPTKEEATAAALRTRRTGLIRRACPRCNGWHVILPARASKRF
jgi:hypothetical protein